ncbi:MAG: hypothetical protein FWH29_06245 [Methanobrevibacter sp.]|nr:hypothetical protein [Methanobrevibacter sp.]
MISNDIKLKNYVSKFFNELEISGHEKFSKVVMKMSINNFLEHENKDNAFEVYREFFDIYRFNMMKMFFSV